ncbi:MAG: ATP-binding protein [Urechidicola sp.]|nr:ATP-binding protein [Urechidicola sp.]
MRLNHMVKGTLLRLLCLLLFISVSIQAQNETISQQKELLISIAKQIDEKNTEAAQLLIDEALELKSSDNDLFAIKLNYYQAEIFILNENDEKALELLLEGHSDIERLGALKFDIKYDETIGRIFSRAKNYEKALKYFKEGVEHSLELNDSVLISSLYLNTGSAYQNLRMMDSAEVYYKKVLEFLPKKPTSDETLATAYINLIGVAIGKGDFVLAEEYGKKSIELHEKRGDTIKLAGALANMGSLNMYTQNLETSKEYYIRTLDLLAGRTDMKSREVNAVTLDNLSQVFYLQEDYRTGYDYLFESVEYNQNLMSEISVNKITEIEAKYNVEQKEKDTEIEKQRRQIAEILLYVFGGITIVLLVIIWLFVRTNRLKKQKLDLELLQKKMKQDRELEVIQNETQIKILNATLDGKEAERRQIAEILHDNVSTLLSSANMHLYAVKSELKSEAPEEVAKIEMIIGEASDKIRDLSHKLISSVLLKFGLATATEDLCEKYSNSQLVFNSESKGIKRYDQSFEIKIHNINEELINNILKHSNANMATIELFDVNNTLKIQITDNGDGFDVDEVIHKDGLGLSQIKARIKMMRGSFEIKSYQDTGTQVNMEIPIPD